MKIWEFAILAVLNSGTNALILGLIIYKDHFEPQFGGVSLYIKWNLIRLGSPSHGVVSKTIHNTAREW